MFWVGLFGGICVYALMTLIMFLVAKHKQKKQDKTNLAKPISKDIKR